MAESVREAIRDRVTLRPVLAYVAVFGFLFWFFDEPVIQLGTSLATGLVMGFSGILAEAYDLRSKLKSLVYGLVVLVSGVGLFSLGDSGSCAGLAFMIAGSWIVLDSGQVLRRDGLKTDETPDRDGHEVFQEYVTRQVDSALREQGLTRRELGVRLEADDAAIDRALSTLDDRGLLTRHGSELGVSSPPKPGVIGRVRNGIEHSVGRLARPLTIEFENESDDAAAARREIGDTSPD